MLILKFLSGKKLKLIVDSKILPVANTNRARTQRNLYSTHYGKRVQFEELYYGVLVMVLCDKAKSAWLRNLVGLAEVYGDRGYKEDKSIRQVVEGVISCVKSFNAVGR
ncbi:MAG: hypothetical protein RMJ51_04850 [Candidatus Calescibacterium sp.]|nr:hypothetical protein [Candidatus Calescibacterium sp.]MDW8195547.1 hypothetical protein [Candidatus Calescibacterium sp.]